MNLYITGLSLIILFLIELLYFKIAAHYNIVDKPNHRSSHKEVTIRGGGVIFPVAFLIAAFYVHWEYPYFLTGLFIISIISFADDVKPVSKRARIIFHLAAVALLFFQLKIYLFSFYWLLLGVICTIGVINAVNFMDGINGLTGVYALTALTTLYYIDSKISFIDDRLLIVAIISVLVFLFFNFRKKARCFAGDVGSVSIALIMVFFIFQIIFKTGNLSYILLLLIYGLDACSTIFFRLLRKENIFEAHRSHFYQFLVNEKKMPHLFVASIYAVCQFLVNILVIFFSPGWMVVLMILISAMFIALRFTLEGQKRLMHS